ncbi:helix-turn-helix transcriptional regulator [Paenisporosarcina sp. TG-14]|uniref:helix-turn-helix transcriptional regulator n=1 Tax=Paenisporosarcina sp. TG-14 TaxID=1231057 RepID=UPI000303830E|nr:helix-turn-helix transcriptional regulator [Paenisporosarcina sp. TG-14]
MKNFVKEKRVKFNMTQDYLSDQLNVSRQTIISLEKGRYNPSINLAFKLSHLFSCTIEDLFVYEEDEELTND